MATKKYSMAGETKDWQASSDMQTLIEARKIKADSKRLKAAIECAKAKKEMLEEITEYAPEKE